ncbi:hypothetical protein CSKR_114048 [Clonorchis sinensis]|uniref:Uncharacterized protein n=1 Tax=Clonorchis sinensis TaxID=79923 RepID=A0A3R7EWE9_CLOSI|nr:hypothetical protein CSKR_114048 [Clonorchis sinensis]
MVCNGQTNLETHLGVMAPILYVDCKCPYRCNELCCTKLSKMFQINHEALHLIDTFAGEYGQIAASAIDNLRESWQEKLHLQARPHL